MKMVEPIITVFPRQKHTQRIANQKSTQFVATGGYSCLYAQHHPEDARGIEKVLSFRKRVREEFDRLVACIGEAGARCGH